MKKLLITGATGTVGQQVINSLHKLYSNYSVIAAVRDIHEAQEKFKAYENLRYRVFDFEDGNSFSKALIDIDILFLLRPPHLTSIDNVFNPLLKEAKLQGVNKVVFLSVQGAERSKVIPHRKIEDLILRMSFEYIFLRPGYFMQNLTGALLTEIQKDRKITLPAGDARFNWIDVVDIGTMTAKILTNFDQHSNRSYFINGPQNLDFTQVAATISSVTGKKISYHSINPFLFYWKKRKGGLNHGFAMVMTIIHFLPRWQKEPIIHKDYIQVTGEKPTLLSEFAQRERDLFL